MRCSVLISGDQADTAEFSLLFTESATEAELNKNGYVQDLQCLGIAFGKAKDYTHTHTQTLSLSPPHPYACSLGLSQPHEVL